MGQASYYDVEDLCRISGAHQAIFNPTDQETKLLKEYMDKNRHTSKSFSMWGSHHLMTDPRKNVAYNNGLPEVYTGTHMPNPEFIPEYKCPAVFFGSETMPAPYKAKCDASMGFVCRKRATNGFGPERDGNPRILVKNLVDQKTKVFTLVIFQSTEAAIPRQF